MNSKIEAILWDNDGVLVDTEQLFFQANRESLAELGVTLDLKDFAEINLRQGQSVIRYHASKLGKTPEEITALHRERDKRYSLLLADEVPVLTGVRVALEKLAPHFRQAIVTSSLPEHFHFIHERTKLKPHFELILTRDCYKLAKPNAEPYLTAAAQLGVPPSSCIVIEDTERGLRSATQAGMRCVVIPNHLMPEAEWTDAWAIATSATEAAELILQAHLS